MAAYSVQARGILPTSKPSFLLTGRSGCSVRRPRGLVVQAFKTQERGASGLDVEGMRPTSPAAWQIMREQLRARKVKMTSQHELLFAKEKGIPIIDIRPPEEFNAAHIPGSVNIPLYRPITGWGTRRVLRRAGFAFFGIFNGTELNPDFFSDIVAAVSKELGAVLLCNIGGKIEVTETNPAGTQSRSLIAAYEITKLNITDGDICVLKGGFGEWQRSGRPVEKPAGK